MSSVDSIHSSRPASTVSRRGALALGAAASALLLGPRSASASIRTGGGIAGGGWVRWETGEAQLSVFGSRFSDDETDAPVIFGSLLWADASGFTLTSEGIDSYGSIEPAATTRELKGFLRNSDGDTLHAFTLTMVDGGGPGEKLDTISLAVGPALAAEDETSPAAAVSPATAVISVEATLEVGDLQLLTFAFAE